MPRQRNSHPKSIWCIPYDRNLLKFQLDDWKVQRIALHKWLFISCFQLKWHKPLSLWPRSCIDFAHEAHQIVQAQINSPAARSMNKHIIWLSLDLALCVWPLREHNTALTLVLCDVILCVCAFYVVAMRYKGRRAASANSIGDARTLPRVLSLGRNLSLSLC